MTDARAGSHSMSEFPLLPPMRRPARRTPRRSRRARRRCSQRCGFVHYDNPTPVVAAVVEHDGKVLLARNKAWPETWYALVAGFLERDETPGRRRAARGARRKWDSTAARRSLIGVYPFARMNQVILAYHVSHVRADARWATSWWTTSWWSRPHCGAWRAGTGWALRDWLRARGHEPVMTDLPG